MSDVNHPDGPVYVLTQREAVETVDDEAVVVDPQFILVGKVPDEQGSLTNEDGIILFTTREFAERCRAKIQKMDSVVATFEGSEHLETFLRDFLNRGYRSVIMNRNSGVGRESIISIQEVIDGMEMA